jgi:hypothetical protein
VKDSDRSRMRDNENILTKLNIPPNELKKRYTLEGTHPKTHKSPSANSGGVGRAGRRQKRWGKKKH